MLSLDFSVWNKQIGNTFHKDSSCIFFLEYGFQKVCGPTMMEKTYKGHSMYERFFLAFSGRLLQGGLDRCSYIDL